MSDWWGLTAPIPPLAPVMSTVFPSKRDELNTDMVVEERVVGRSLSDC